MVNATCLNTSQSLTSKCWIFFNCSFIEKKTLKIKQNLIKLKQNVQSCNDIPNTCKIHVLICMFIHVDLFHVIYIHDLCVLLFDTLLYFHWLIDSLVFYGISTIFQPGNLLQWNSSPPWCWCWWWPDHSPTAHGQWNQGRS